MDRRVSRSRSALLAAAVRLVSERGTTAIPVTDLADAANVSRQLVYLQFGDRDALLVAAAADLVTRELLEGSQEFQVDDMRPGVLATTRHFAEHQAFYRPMLTGTCAYAMSRTMNRVFQPFNARFLLERFTGLDEATAHDLAMFSAAGAGEIVNDWVINGPEPLDPDEAADRLMRLAAVFPGGYR
jgi:AcrR family transcriptional regulator